MTHHREIYRASQLPVFQNRMFRSELDARNCTKGDIRLVLDAETGLVYNQAFKPELMQYDTDYQNEQAISIGFQRHLQDVSRIIETYFDSCSLMEVGCGKGYFLEQLQGMGFEITGLDPAYEGSNPAVIKKYLSPEVGVRADGIILRHVLEHVQDPVGFLSNIRDSNGGAGKIYIEVPCLDWICEHRAWFDIFYEHVNYFRLKDFERMFATIHESGRIFGSQYLYVVADLATIRTPVLDGSDDFEFPADFTDRISQFAARLSVGAKGRRANSAVWGGASKGVIFTLYMQRAGANIDLVVDINTAKQGKHLPATGLQVRSPEEAMRMLSPGADIFVMNSNYLSEIRELTAQQFNYLLVEHDNIQRRSKWQD